MSNIKEGLQKSGTQICKLANLLSKIPPETWNAIVQKEPEWRHMREILEKYGFGRFAVLMLAAGLNDFQLKGKAEITYWPKLREILDRHKVPDSLEELENILAVFYRNERLPNLKLKRLNRFLSSELAKKLWRAKPDEVAKDFLRIWHELANTMRQSRKAKTITFAMKCLGIVLLMVGKSDFNFEKIPIPVDYRVRTFTKRLGVAVKDDDVRRFWNGVLKELRKDMKINMIHLDSLIWQIGTLSRHELVKYFAEFGLEHVGEKIVEMMGELRLCVVSCGSRKIWDKNPDAGPTKARDVYIGSFAKICIEYAEKFYPNSYVILSAKYGFLFPDEIIPENYNVTFNDPKTNPISIEELRKQAERKGLTKYNEIVVMAGSEYVKIVKRVFVGKKIIIPLKGLSGMGSMISAMKKAIREEKELTNMDLFCKHGRLKTRCSICSPRIKRTQTSPLSPRIFAEDRNLAFKCNWMDTDYEKPCGEVGRKWNVHVRRSIWCTQPENPCYQFEMGLRRDIPTYPCYESEIFTKSEYGAGVNHTGVRKGIGRKIRYVIPGKLAIFTTVDPGRSENERYIFGFFVIKDHYIDDDGATKVVGHPEYTLKIPKDSRLKFWDFYRNADGSIFWGTGLYRYLSDEVVVRYLKRQQEVLTKKGHKKEAKVVKVILKRFYAKDL